MNRLRKGRRWTALFLMVSVLFLHGISAYSEAEALGNGAVTETEQTVLQTEMQLAEDEDTVAEMEETVSGGGELDEESGSGRAESDEMIPEAETESGSGISETAEPDSGEASEESAKESEHETSVENEVETESVPETETESEAETESEQETETEDVPETESGSESEAESAEETESGTESKTESESELNTERETESESETETETEAESESETESEIEQEYLLEALWQDGPFRRAGDNSRLARAATPMVYRDNNFTLSYLGFYCYFKYVANSGMDTGGKDQAAYCVYNPLEGPNGEPYEPTGKGAFSKEITYCLYNGCRYRGETSYNSAYSTGDWRKDYYLTQIAIHLINAQQGRESSIEKKLDKSKDSKVYNLVCKMIDDAYADSKKVSGKTNQTKEVTYTVSPESQNTWSRQADGTWRTSADYVCKTNHTDRLVSVDYALGENTPVGVSIKRKNDKDLLSSFWLTATDEAYRKIAKDKITLTVTLSVKAEEYGGWWYAPVSGDTRWQYVTFLSPGSVSLENQPQVMASADTLYFSVTVKKKDAGTGAALAGAVYGLYSNEACSALVGWFPATDGNGEAKLQDLMAEQETYYVREKTAPRGYLPDPTVYPVTPGSETLIHLELTDRKQKASLRVYKEGELLTGAEPSEDGVHFLYMKERLKGAVFALYAAETIADASGAVVYQKDALVADHLETNQDGIAQADNLPAGSYYLVEKSAPQFMVGNKERIPVTLRYGDEQTEVQINEVTVRNVRQRAAVQIRKKDSENGNGVKGGVFGLYAEQDIFGSKGELLVKAGTLLARAISDQNGMASFQADLSIGYAYSVREEKAPFGYQCNKAWQYHFKTENHPEQEVQEFSADCAEHAYQAAVELRKIDLETGEAIPQGDASLEGARYGLFAREAVVHPDGVTGILLKAGEQAAMMTTDANGKASVTDLYPGSYYLKELTPPEGYVKDETEYEILISGEEEPEDGADGQKLMKILTVKEQVKKQPFQLLKVSSTGVTEPTPLPGAGFTAYLISDLEQKDDGTYDTEHAVPVVIGASGETELFTDEHGYLCTIPLPYGSYLVRETTVPENHKPVRDFVVTVSEHSPDSPQPWRVLADRAFTARLKIVKKDKQSGETVQIPGAEFKIWDYARECYVEQRTTYPNNKKHTSYFTGAEGFLMLPEPLIPGKYRIEEVTAPEGYLQSAVHTDFEVADDVAYQTDGQSGEAVIRIEIADQPVSGVIEIRKTGERLGSYAEDFCYEETPLSEVIFEIRAEEDICTPDGQREEDGSRKILYAKGTLAAVLTTDEHGYAVTEPLPLGVYRITERQAPTGFLPDPEGVVVRLDWQGQTQAVVTASAELINTRQKVRIRVKKTDQDTGETLSGAEFGLYAKENLCGRDGSILVKAGEQVDSCVTGENGEGVFSKDLPHGFYLVREEKAPEGYVNQMEEQEADLRAGKQEVNPPEVLELLLTFVDQQTQVEVSKTDLTNGEEIPGAHLELRDEVGTLIEDWISEEEPHRIYGLVPGKTYTLTETLPAPGYVTAESVVITVENSGEIQRAEMKDDITKVLISKQDITDGSELPGAELTILAADGKEIEHWVSEKEPHLIERLPIGSYTLREETAPSGYLVAEEVEFEVLDTGEIQEVTMQDRPEPEESETETETETQKRPGPKMSQPRTGDPTPVVPAVLALVLAAIAAVWLWIQQRKSSRRR